MKRLAAAALLYSAVGPALAGVAIDSFNSAGANAAPSLAIEHGASESVHRKTGPADALVRMAERNRKSVIPPPGPPGPTPAP